MPLEMEAIVQAFGLDPPDGDEEGHFEGRVGRSQVSAIHIGMGPSRTRSALSALLHDDVSGRHPTVDHVMVAGICGGLSPELEVGTLINPEYLVEHATGKTYRHRPPGDAPLAGKLVTTENATLDPDLSRRFFADGFMAVDMESAAVAAVCEPLGLPWSVYRCIGDRYFDGLLDERIVALANPDGSGDLAAVERLLAAEPELVTKLEQLGRDSALAARLAAEAAVRGCLALDA
jgi:nucleoside phosphorylase